MERYRFLPALLSPLLLLAACASPPDQIPATYVSGKAYTALGCPELESALETNAERAGELRFQLQDKANIDATQAGIGVIFFPTLLFLEGGDGDDAKEYARLKGERKALVAAVRDKGCPIDLERTDMTAAACDARRGEKCPPAFVQRIPALR